MSVTDSSSLPLMSDQLRDLEAASRAHAAISRRADAGVVPATADSTLPDGFLEFSSQVDFFVTVGYLTQEQAKALLNWYLNRGLIVLPALDGPAGGPSPRMYELLTTAIHFGTPEAVRNPSPGGDIGDFFSALASAVGGLIETVGDTITEVLNAGTGLVQAATQFVHELHDLAVLAP